MKKNLLLLFYIFCLFGEFNLSSYEQTDPSLGIPNKIHFVYGIWDKGELPHHFKSTIEAWKKQGWEVKLWQLAEIENLLNLSEYEEHKKTYNSLSRKIQKADYIRYLIVYHEGGFYFDLDCPPTNNSLLEALQSRWDALKNVFFVEITTSEGFAADTAKKYPIRKGIPESTLRIANFAFGCCSHSPTLLKIMELAKERCEANPVIYEDYDILYTTGPDCFTEVVSKELDSIELITSTYSYMKHLGYHSWYFHGDR